MIVYADYNVAICEILHYKLYNNSIGNYKVLRKMKIPNWIIIFLFSGLVYFSFNAAEGINFEYPVKNPPLQTGVNTTPSCLDRSDIPDEEYHWLYIPSDPGELATYEYYGFLSGELIRAGMIDASDCPSGGLWLNGYANSCGLQKAHDAVVYLQNVYDDEILAEGQRVGVPPIMIKQLIRYESQFWPVQMDIYHYGLGHITYLGILNGMIWNPELYADACQAIYGGPCTDPYFQISRESDALLAGQFLALMDASCPSCEYTIDISKAERSIRYITETLLGYCKQTSQIIYNITNKPAKSTMTYATLWKLTLVNYNAGPMCVYDAVRLSYTSDDADMSWLVISNKMDENVCKLAVTYTNNITARYYDFQK